MISTYNNLKSVQPKTVVSMHELTELIKDHPQKKLIMHLHTLPYKGDEYNKLKADVICCTPHGKFSGRRKKGNLDQLSPFLYYDIDKDAITCEISAYKQSIIENYGSQLACVGVSVGGRGLFIYVRVSGVTESNFDDAYQFVADTVLKTLPIDRNAKGVSRCQIIPFDPDLYFNPEGCVILPDLPKTENPFYTIPKKIPVERFEPYIPIDELLASLKRETSVDTDGMLFKIEPVSYYRLFFPRVIKDGKKHTTFRAITQGLMFLNPEITLREVLSYIWYLNQNHTSVPMVHREMARTVTHEYERLKETGELTLTFKTRCLHFHKNATAIEKKELASYVNGLLRRLRSIERIERAVQSLGDKVEEYTYAQIAKAAGISVKTVQRNKGCTKEEIIQVIISANRVVDNVIADC